MTSPITRSLEEQLQQESQNLTPDFSQALQDRCIDALKNVNPEWQKSVREQAFVQAATVRPVIAVEPYRCNWPGLLMPVAVASSVAVLLAAGVLFFGSFELSSPVGTTSDTSVAENGPSVPLVMPPAGTEAILPGSGIEPRQNQLRQNQSLVNKTRDNESLENELLENEPLQTEQFLADLPFGNLVPKITPESVSTENVLVSAGDLLSHLDQTNRIHQYRDQIIDISSRQIAQLPDKCFSLIANLEHTSRGQNPTDVNPVP